MDSLIEYADKILLAENGKVLLAVSFAAGWLLKRFNQRLRARGLTTEYGCWVANQYITLINAVICGLLSVFVPALSVNGESPVVLFVNGAIVAVVASFGYDKLREIKDTCRSTFNAV